MKKSDNNKTEVEIVSYADLDRYTQRQDTPALPKPITEVEIDAAGIKAIRKVTKKALEGKLDDDKHGGLASVIDAIQANTNGQIHLSKLQKDKLMHSMKNDYLKEKQDYKDTHILGLNKSVGQKLKTAGAMVSRTAETAIDSLEAAAGLAVFGVGRAIRFATRGNETQINPIEKFGRTLAGTEALEIVKILKKNTAITEVALTAIKGIEAPTHSIFVVDSNNKGGRRQ